MPMLAFLPWSTVSKSLEFGRYRIVPVGVALDGEIPEVHQPALAPILQAYARPRPVDQRSTPLIHREDIGLTDDLSPDQIADYFAFRTRLAFAVLSARRFFTHRYANSDNAVLIIQGFTPERAGGAVLQYRRRDGSTTVIVPPGNLSVPRPHHVDRCELTRDLDAPLLAALETVAAREGEQWGRLEEAIRLFVGANTDAPSVDIHTELIDVVSAFSRLADAWDAKKTVERFNEVLPSPAGATSPSEGAKLTHPRIEQGLAKGRSVREIWLDDAYVLRSQFGHGRVQAPGYRSIWNEREHLLLAAVVFPLYVKMILASEGFYDLTDNDVMMNDAFDDLAVFEPFATPADEQGISWNQVMMHSQVRQLARLFERQEGTEHNSGALD
ncbi:MAG TPA: hypothetical protein VFJ16_10680 [Longimicrobium sp.]|nr:hypothetical protein [Longimicrobium sp.]